MTLLAAVERWASLRPDAPFLTDPEDRGVTWAEFFDRTSAATSTLARRGIGPCDVVASVSRNEIDVLVAMFATWRLGAVFSPINPGHDDSAMASMLQALAPAIVVVDRDDPSALEDRWEVIGLAQLAPDAPRLDIPRWPCVADAPALVLFTRGSTGPSKGCVLSHDHLVWIGEEWCAVGEMHDGDVVLSLGDFCHINAVRALAGSIVNGSAHAFERRFAAPRFWPRAAATGATVFEYVGVIVTILMRSPHNPFSRCSLRVGLGGGAPSPDVQAFEERFGITLVEGYGLTEATLPILQTQSARKLGSMGRLSPWFDARVNDSRGAPVPVGECGELWLRARHRRAMFDGYYRAPDETAAALDGDWFRTRDIVRRDAEGWFYFVERSR